MASTLSHQVSRIDPAGIVTSDSTGDGVGCCLTGAQHGGEARPSCAAGTAAGGVVLGEEDVTRALITGVPDRPECLVQGGSDDSVFEDDPVIVVSHETIKVDVSYFAYAVQVSNTLVK